MYKRGGNWRVIEFDSMLSYQIAPLLDGVGRRSFRRRDRFSQAIVCCYSAYWIWSSDKDKSSRRNRLLVRDNYVCFDAILILLCTKTFCQHPFVVSQSAFSLFSPLTRLSSFVLAHVDFINPKWAMTAAGLFACLSQLMRFCQRYLAPAQFTWLASLPWNHFLLAEAVASGSDKAVQPTRLLNKNSQSTLKSCGRFSLFCIAWYRNS